MANLLKKGIIKGNNLNKNKKNINKIQIKNS